MIGQCMAFGTAKQLPVYTCLHIDIRILHIFTYSPHISGYFLQRVSISFRRYIPWVFIKNSINYIVADINLGEITAAVSEGAGIKLSLFACVGNKPLRMPYLFRVSILWILLG